MSQEEIQQAARKEKWVSKADIVKISTTNRRINPIITQKEETYQVILEIIKNTTFYKAFLTSVHVLELHAAILYIDFAELIWEDFSYQINNIQSKKGRREIMPYPRFTKIIINHFLSIHTSVPKGLPSGLHTIKDDNVLSRMKFVRIGENFQEYGRAILDTMLTNKIKQSETYQIFIKYSTRLLHLKKSRGKGSQGKKSADTPKPASVKVSDESNSKPARKRTGSRRVIKKKVSISAEDSIIPELDVTLELGKSMSLTEAAKKEAVSSGSKEESEYSEEETVNKEIHWVYSNEEEEKKDDDDDDDKSINIKETNDEEANDKFRQGDEYVQENVDEEMKDAECNPLIFTYIAAETNMGYYFIVQQS
nr:hypothetical protein [Tanacetum cinerariifolium]